MPCRALARSCVVAVLIALAAYGYLDSGLGRTARAQDQPPPTFKTEANYVRVDVYPTRDGQPVMDLTAADFEVLEDKVPQKIDAFQHIVVRGNVPQEVRREPNTLAESRQMLENPNARAFVVFLDTKHVGVDGSHDIRQPLVTALNRLIGENDLVAVMTPEMSAADITFARRTTTIEGMLTGHWTWGQREQLNSTDPMEDQYRACYPGLPHRCADGSTSDDRGVYAEMIDRRREKQTIDALEDLVRFLRGVREERKAVIAVTEGWLLFRPDPSLMRKLNCHTPGADIYVDPRTGKPSTKAPAGPGGTSPDACDRDRQALANIDDAEQFRRILDEANRANTSFYPVDPRGLAVFDTPIAPVNGPSLFSSPPPVPAAADNAILQSRLTSLRTLAEATDGLAIVNSNNLDAGFRRIVDDLSSYYLLGYYSSGRLDGKFHSITVRIKRPGVQVRARRGFLAATAAEMRTASAPPSPAAAAADAETAIVERALAPLGNYGRELPLRIRAAGGWVAGAPRIWVVGELGAAQAAANGGDVELTLTQPNGGPVETTMRASIEPGSRVFRATIVAADPLPPDDYVVRVRTRVSSPSAGQPSPPAAESTDVFRFTLPPPPTPFGALLFRRGPTTMNRDVPTTDLRFRRSEQIRVEVPVAAAESATARLLDRTGKPLPCPSPSRRGPMRTARSGNPRSFRSRRAITCSRSRPDRRAPAGPTRAASSVRSPRFE